MQYRYSPSQQKKQLLLNLSVIFFNIPTFDTFLSLIIDSVIIMSRELFIRGPFWSTHIRGCTNEYRSFFPYVHIRVLSVFSIRYSDPIFVSITMALAGTRKSAASRSIKPPSQQVLQTCLFESFCQANTRKLFLCVISESQNGFLINAN